MPRDIQTLLNWLDQPLALVRRSGRTEEAPFSALLEDMEDPVVTADCGHPVLQLGFELLASHILQIVMPPADDDDWRDMLFTPPTRAMLDAALLPYRDTFLLTGTETPFFQVNPRQEWTSNPQPISGLLPDTPSGTAISNDEDFFVKRGNYGAVHASLAAPLLYAAEMLFPSGGGGYHDIPHKAGSLKYQVTGRTLWETLWLNVLPRDWPDLRLAAWPAPVDASVFPWLMRNLRDLDLGRQSENKRRALVDAGGPVLSTVISIDPGQRHPAGFAMPRRYLLDPPRAGTCSVTGRAGLVFDSYQRWPQGLSYAADGWVMPYVAPLEKFTADGASDARWYSQAAGPLRLTDWLSPALGQEAPAEGARVVAHPPPVVRALRSRLLDLTEAFEEAEGKPTAESQVAEELPFSVRVVAQFTFGKTVEGMSDKTLPLYRLSAEGQRDLAQRTADAARRVAEIAGILRKHATGVLKSANANASPKLPGQLFDSLLRDMEARLMEALPALASAVEAESAQALRHALEKEARQRAVTLFDGAFPVETTDDLAERVAQVRRRLIRDLFSQPQAADHRPAA